MGEHCTFTSPEVCSRIAAVKLIRMTIVLMSIYDTCFETNPFHEVISAVNFVTALGSPKNTKYNQFFI